MFFAVSVFAQNNLKVAAIFSDGMVLQRGVDIPVWGTANTNEEVKVVFKNKIYSAKANKKGAWKIVLPKQEIGEPLELIISTKKYDTNNNRIEETYPSGRVYKYTYTHKDNTFIVTENNKVILTIPYSRIKE